MQAKISQENFARALSIVKPASAAKSTLPVLSNVLLTANGDGKLKLTATNLEIVIITTMPAQIQVQGAVTLPTKALSDYLNALPPDTLEFKLNPKTQTLALKCARFDANIKGMEADEFPLCEIPKSDADGAVVFSMDPQEFREVAAQVCFSAAHDDTRPALLGVCLSIAKNGKRATFASADGFRLSVRTAPIQSDLKFKKEGEFKIVIPAVALQRAAGLVGDQEEPVEIRVNPQRSQIAFLLTTTTLLANLIEGNFPDFEAITPKSHSTRAVINVHELTNAVKAANVFARDASFSVRLKIDAASAMSDGQLQISARSAETGDSSSLLDATVEGKGIETAFNARFLIEFLNVLNEPQIALETDSSASPGVFKPVGRDDYQHIIMPIHTDA